jgi:hypothetical protein
MRLNTIFAPFVKERPICVMARAVLERLLDAPRIEDLFARTAQRHYTRERMVSSLGQLMRAVVPRGASHRPGCLYGAYRGHGGVDHGPVPHT